MTEHKNRVPGTGKANRKLITPEGGGTPYYATVEFADDPTEAGTPITKVVLDELLAASGTTAGTATALTLAQTGFVLTDGAEVRFKLHADLGSNPTLNVNATGAVNLLAPDLTAAAGIKSGSWVTAIYNGSAYILQGTASHKHWSQLQAYETPGIYTYTVPAGVTEIGVEIIGGGGGGALSFSYQYDAFSRGGASGQIKQKIMSVYPGQEIPVVVGVGGAAGTRDCGSGYVSGGWTNVGGNGGSSSFNSVAAAGGEGGTAHGDSVGSAFSAVGSLGGQSTADFSWVTTSQMSAVHVKEASLGAIYDIACDSYIASPGMFFVLGAKTNLNCPQEMLSLFRDDPQELVIGAGGFAWARATTTYLQPMPTYPNAYAAGPGYAYGTPYSAGYTHTAGNGSGKGNGGGGLALYNNSNNSCRYVHTAGAGAPGAVYIYAKGA